MRTQQGLLAAWRVVVSDCTAAMPESGASASAASTITSGVAGAAQQPAQVFSSRRQPPLQGMLCSKSLSLFRSGFSSPPSWGPDVLPHSMRQKRCGRCVMRAGRCRHLKNFSREVLALFGGRLGFWKTL